MNIDRRFPVALILALGLGACATESVIDHPGDSVFGEANRITMMAQVVNPDPYYPDPMTTSGEHAANAIERYRNDAVIQPESISTTEGATGGN